MISLGQSRQQQIKSALLPLSARRGEISLLKSSSMVEEINLSEILEQDERKLSSTRCSSFRQTQQLSFIKDRFKRMIQLQNRNFLQRTQLQKEREAVLREQEVKARNKVNRVKDQRSHIGQASKNWRVRNMQEGAIIRQRKLHNQWIKTKREGDELKDKQLMISDRHKSMMATHSRAIQARNELSAKGRLKVSQEYRWGLIRQMSQLITPRACKQHQQQGNKGRQYEWGNKGRQYECLQEREVALWGR